MKLTRYFHIRINQGAYAFTSAARTTSASNVALDKDDSIG
jgi:hypothetical protein